MWKENCGLKENCGYHLQYQIYTSWPDSTNINENILAFLVGVVNRRASIIWKISSFTTHQNKANITWKS